MLNGLNDMGSSITPTVSETLVIFPKAKESACIVMR